MNCAGLCCHFAGTARKLVAFEKRIEDSVSYLVADLVRVPDGSMIIAGFLISCLQSSETGA